MSDRTTQKARILSLLQSQQMVALPDILALQIASYTRRISELRHEDGYDIVCHKWQFNGQTHIKYELKGQAELFGSMT